MANIKTTIYDISEKSGVSIATVSRVINNASNVSETTRQKVLKVMEECGYTPNAFARGLGLTSTQTVGILCADSSDIYYAKALYNLEEKLKACRYDSILCCTGYDQKDREKSMDLLLSKKVDAVVLVGSTFVSLKDRDNKYIKEAAASLPVMVLNASLRGDNIYSVYCNDCQTLEDVTSYLIEGHRDRIIYLYNSKSYSGLKKLEGFRSAISKSKGTKTDIEGKAFFCTAPKDNVEMMVNEIEGLLSGQSFNALIASDDALAVCALKACKRLGLSVPEDVNIVGINNSLIAQLSEPALSSIDNKLNILCSKLVDNLMDLLSGREAPSVSEYTGELVVRETTTICESASAR